MDPFAYFPRENVRVLERDRAGERIRDGWSPDRRELRELIGTLRARYGRRRLFRVADVEETLDMIRGREPRTVLRFAPRTPERPERTSSDEV